MDRSFFIDECCRSDVVMEQMQMKYYVYDEDNKMIRCFRWKHEAIAFLQPGWSIQVKKVVKRDGYSEALLLGEAWI